MAKKVKVIVLRTAGTNCDDETAYAFQHFGADVEKVHINKLFSGDVKLDAFQILAIPGGFTYGDDIAAGRILANELRLRLGKDMKRFISDGKLMIGICNGFQVLVKAGILPGPFEVKEDTVQSATLMTNDSGKFEDRWTFLSVSGKCVWTKDLKDVVYFPVAHAEGKFVPRNKDVLQGLKDSNQIVFRYCTKSGDKPEYPQNPNASVEDIAGITDDTGRILGIMPHPERHFIFENHPQWTRLTKKSDLGDGAKIFENGVNFIKNNNI